MRVETPDFIYVSEDPTPPPPVRQGASRGIPYTDQTFLGMPVPVDASPEWFGVRIEARVQPRTGDGWKGALGEVPDTQREATRAYLRARWVLLEDRLRRDTVGKASAAGDAAMAEMGKRYGRV